MAKEQSEQPESNDTDGEALWRSIYQPDATDDNPGEQPGSDDADSEVIDLQEKDKPEVANEPRENDSAQEQEDDLDGLTLQNAQERIRNAQARMHAATQELAEIRKAMEPLQRENAQLRGDIQMLQQEVQRLRQPPPASAQAPADSGIDDDDLKSAKEEWPEVVNPLLKRNQLLEARLKQIEQQVQETVTVTQETQQRSAAEAHQQAILAKHPDAFDLAGTDDFQGWVSRQPPLVRQVVETGTAQDVIWVLDQYKQLVGAGNRLEQAREASTPTTPRARQQTTRSGPRFTRSQIEAMSPEEWRQNEAEILKAMAQGQIA
ncbi:MAG: hypothetical protein HQL47_06130 [Gammaproteobacteria bacterium]|nr:hypothetical protein [Gammaproteobacteria bacterium]